MSDTLDPTARPGGGRALRIAGISAIIVLCLTTLSTLVGWLAHMRFSIPSSSMNPTVYVGDYVLASRAIWDSDLERGDVAVFLTDRLTGGGSQVYYITRVIGLPGDKSGWKRTSCTSTARQWTATPWICSGEVQSVAHGSCRLSKRRCPADARSRCWKQSKEVH